MMNIPSLVIAIILSKVPYNVACKFANISHAWNDEVSSRYNKPTYQPLKYNPTSRYMVKGKKRKITALFDGELRFCNTIVGVDANFIWRSKNRKHYIRSYVMDDLIKCLDVIHGIVYGSWVEIEFSKNKTFLFPFNPKWLST